MVKVFISEAVGAGIYVFSDDHCPPHIHARHRGDEWVARIKFSYITTMIDLISIAPLRNIPLQRVVNQLLDDVAAHLAVCRRRWWEIRRTSCLVNQWAVIQKSGSIVITGPSAATAKQITTADYDPDSGRLNIVFQDGSLVEWES
jgi:hypothetical protein